MTKSPLRLLMETVRRLVAPRAPQPIGKNLKATDPSRCSPCIHVRERQQPMELDDDLTWTEDGRDR